MFLENNFKKTNIYTFDFAKEFSPTPGPRFSSLGPYSGEKFRSILIDLLNIYEFIIIDVSDVKSSFNPGFINEAFYMIKNKLNRISFVKNGENCTYLKEKVLLYTQD